MTDYLKFRRAMQARARAAREAAQIAAGDPYADLDEARAEELSRGLHFERDGAALTDHRGSEQT